MVSTFGLCGPTFATRDPFWNQERVVNWYPAVDSSGGRAQSKAELSPTPGLTLFATLLGTSVRGLYTDAERLFAVSSGFVIEVFADGTSSNIGAILDAGTPVQIAANGQNLLIATANEIWEQPGAGVAVKVADGISAVYLDGYYIILWPDRQTVQISNDGINWDELDVAQRIWREPILRLEVHEGNLWLIGNRSISVWYNSGNADFPFEPIRGAVIEQGTLAPWSVCQIEQNLYWIGSDESGQGRVFRSEGYSPVRISNEAVEHILRQYLQEGYAALGQDERITGSGYEENGHTFYVIGLPRAKACLVYDLTTNMWHERAGWDGTNWQFWKGGSHHAFVFGKHIVAPIGAGDGKIYEQNINYYTEAGAPIRRYRAAPFVQADQQWLFHHYLRLLVRENGTSVSLRYQNDDHTAWSALRTIAPFRNEVKYRRLGRGRSRMYEVSLTDSTTSAQAIVEGYLSADPGVQR